MDLEVGQKAQREMAVTAAMVKSYAEITGDYNPLHFYEEFTSKTRFDGLICQGGVTTGLLHALVAMEHAWPGNSLPQSELELPQAGVHR